ncbi:MAG TPA: OmpA family protein [Bryobacteraceae bacterium]|nr:OmpA family protein [Bryobacteraceae bacterium]
MILKRVALAPAAVLLLVLSASCPKAGVPSSVPAAPTPAMPSKPIVGFFTAEPTTVTARQPVSLRWSVRNATRVRIDNGLGEVELSGDRQVELNRTTMYKLEAANSSGTTLAALTVTVNSPPPAGAESAEGRGVGSAGLLATQLQDIHFVYDKEEVLETEKAIVDKDAVVLKNLIAADPDVVVIVEGHCDDRGSSEYNLGLGDRRANYIKDLFVRDGLPGNKLNTISYGKEQPVCLSLAEDCLARNRRVHFTPSK